MNKLFSFVLVLSNILLLGIYTSSAHNTGKPDTSANGPVPAANQLNEYLPLLKNKKIALVVNHTSLVDNTHLADTLLSRGVSVVKIFAPEHGFRGKADAGETIKNDVDAVTGLPIVSIYGKNKKPLPEQLKDVDIILFDIQDIGVRFFTYISTMHYVMEAAAENNKEVMILDRPNPNGNYIDGPLMEDKHKSFIGMHSIPIVHGLTVGELAQMINGEKWLAGGQQAKLHIIKAKNYSHKDFYSLPVKPSPNLPNDLSIALYPSICLFEGTIISLGRGTMFPFQVIGYPDKAYGDFSFTPVSLDGMAKNPPLENKVCYGLDLRSSPLTRAFTLKYLIDFYQKSRDKSTYFTPFFYKLTGNEKLREQIQNGLSEEEIRKSWQTDLNKYKEVRKKYLLYPDFE